MDEIGVIAKMPGIAVHDGWKPYRSYDVAHQLCNAHHLRELEAVAVVWDQGWADEMIDLLIEAKEAVEEARPTVVTENSTPRVLCTRSGSATDSSSHKGWAPTPPPRSASARRTTKKAANLLVRLDDQRADVLRFATDFRASCDNNQAERDVRMVKLQQKISGSWRTLAGARNYCADPQLHLDHAQARTSVLDGLRQLFEGDVWLPVGLARS